MSKIVIEYDTYFEIKNGLFIDTENKKHSITRDNLKKSLESVIGGADMNSPSNREVTLFINEERMRQFNRAVQEQMYTQLTNISEQELIQYFDRISQEKEN